MKIHRVKFDHAMYIVIYVCNIFTYNICNTVPYDCDRHEIVNWLLMFTTVFYQRHFVHQTWQIPALCLGISHVDTQRLLQQNEEQKLLAWQPCYYKINWSAYSCISILWYHFVIEKKITLDCVMVWYNKRRNSRRCMGNNNWIGKRVCNEDFNKHLWKYVSEYQRLLIAWELIKALCVGDPMWRLKSGSAMARVMTINILLRMLLVRR